MGVSAPVKEGEELVQLCQNNTNVWYFKEYPMNNRSHTKETQTEHQK